MVWSDRRTPEDQAGEDQDGGGDVRFSVGFTVSKAGAVTRVAWGSPAWKAGFVEGAKIVAVDDEPFDAAILKAAIASTPRGGSINVRVARGATEQMLALAWDGGLRYPHFERVPGSPALLDAILEPRP